jgi:predicted ATPase with chaperone activity
MGRPDAEPGRIAGTAAGELSVEGAAVPGRRDRALGLSARAFDRSLRVARTAADLAGDDSVDLEHVDEAVAYRLADAVAGP